MPLFGTLDVAARAADVPVVTHLGDEAWECPGLEVLHFGFEIEQTYALNFIPPALHPAVPPYVTLMFRRFPTSPVGPFNLAELRVTTRAAIHYGGYVTGAFADRDEAVDWLRDRYGWPVTQAAVEVRRGHHATTGRVDREGTVVAEVALEHAVPVSGADILYVVNLHLARVRDALKLVQVEPEYEFEYAERGRSRVRAFDASAFGEPRLVLATPLPGTYARTRLSMFPVRYLIDPTQPALIGTEAVA